MFQRQVTYAEYIMHQGLRLPACMSFAGLIDMHAIFEFEQSYDSNSNLPGVRDEAGLVKLLREFHDALTCHAF